MDNVHIELQVTKEILAWLDDLARRIGRPSAGAQASAALQQWRDHLSLELSRTPVSLAEASCIADVLNGTMLGDGAGGLLAGEVEDAFAGDPGHYGEKWGVDEEQLLVRLRALGPTADHALFDAMSRWWADPTRANDGAGFSRVGIQVTD